MALLLTILLAVCCSLEHVFCAYIGINFNDNRAIKDSEFDRSLVPMIRLPRDGGVFLRPSVSSIFNRVESEEKELSKYTDNGLRPENDIKPIVSRGKEFSQMLEEKRENYALKKADGNSDKLLENGMIAFQAETADGQKKEFMRSDDGNCYIDGNRIINSEEIYQNDCGTLQCINSEVTWSLKPLSKTLPHCEGIKSIPSVYASYTKIKVVEDDEPQLAMPGDKSTLSRPDIDVVDQRKKIQEASKKMVQAELWD
eukprot:gene7042-12671_t